MFSFSSMTHVKFLFLDWGFGAAKSREQKPGVPGS
jgi:hypothetical protein